MSIEVAWGSKRTPLQFEWPPYTGEYADGYEPEIINALERFLEPGDCAIDAGASVGFHTCLMSRLVDPGGLVVAFEPHRESFEILSRHVHVANKLDNVGLVRAALWSHDCEGLKLWSTEDLGYASMHRYLNSTSYEAVDGIALDSIAQSIGHPRLIKIDCEGTELEVLMGAEQMLTRGVDAVLLELNYHLFRHTDRSDMAIRKRMTALGYWMFLINIGDGNGGFMPPLMVGDDVQINLENGHHINVLFSTGEKVREKYGSFEIARRNPH